VGDLALAGRPLKAQILAARPGHAANVAFARKIKRKMEETTPRATFRPTTPSCPRSSTSTTLPACCRTATPSSSSTRFSTWTKIPVAGVKNVTINEPFFEGHFPGNPVFPGVFQIEAMAQTGGILVLSSVPDPENYWTYFLGVESCRFKKMVVPGDTLIFKCELLAPIKRGIAKMHGEAYVGGT
jgi:UDP-3-O-[3-hydroxymyristoyl] N-acetylglucosamine deacetylase/3-hydroxyacyl-[acyl-carrier-protein] dehydratase